VTFCGCIQIPGHGAYGRIVDIAAGQPGHRRRNILDRDGLKNRARLIRRQIKRQGRERAQHRAAGIGCGRDHKARPQDRMGNVRSRDQPLGLTFCHAEGGLVLIGCTGNGNVDEPDGAAAITDRSQQPRDKIAVHRAGVAARSVLQHAEAVHHQFDVLIPNQPRQRGLLHRQDRHFQVERVGSLRSREFSRDPDDVKAARAQIIGDEAPDQPGCSEHEDFACSHFRVHLPT
jgi:hypothetical protein